MVGQSGRLERKSAGPTALRAGGGTVRSVQRAISDAFRDEDRIMNKYHNMIKDDMGHPDGVIISDESGFPEKGKDSVGVSRQYCGSPGKAENCQVGVSAAYASPYGYALADKRLFIPDKRFTEEYQGMRKKCGVPEEISSETEPHPAAGMPESFYMNGSLPFRYIMTDCLYGNSPEFAETADSCAGKTFFPAVSSDTRCRFRHPSVRRKQYRYGGELKSKEAVPGSRPVCVPELKSISSCFRYKRKVSEGTEGPILYEFTERKITPAGNGLPWKTVRLIVKRTCGKIRYTPIISAMLRKAHV
ncbi:MAG: transposase [Desulfobacteraceae bacterium]|nr:transposase [Desulfobacteraceae bacterium]